MPILSSTRATFFALLGVSLPTFAKTWCLTGEAVASWAVHPTTRLSHHREAKSPCIAGALNLIGSLTMSYFHTGTRTIIGAKSFHCPVRDGKEWGQLAMVIRLKTLSVPGSAWRSQFEESILSAYLDCCHRESPPIVVIHRYNVFVFKRSEPHG